MVMWLRGGRVAGWLRWWVYEVMETRKKENCNNSSENRGEVVSRKCPQKSVESPVHQQDKYAGAGGREGRVKGFGNLYGKMWDCKLSK